MKYDVVTIGSAVRDVFLFVDPADAPIIKNPKRDPKREKLIALEQGAKIDVARSERTIGGGGANAAVTFARFGLKTAAVLRVGADSDGDEAVRALKRERIATRFIQRDPKLCTGFSTLLVAGSAKRDRVAFTVRGASSSNNFSGAERGIAKAAWYYTTALSGQGWKKELSDILQTAQKHGILWAWNPGAAQLKAGLSALARFMKACTVFNANRDEALELVGGKNDIKTLLAALRSAGPERVLISDGPNGAYYADANQMLRMSADRSIKAMEPTGAGDALGAGFIAALIAGFDVPAALSAGIANSESVICAVGAQAGILRKNELSSAMQKRNHTLSYV
ncbi:MAG: carbohydrate kinase family protein [Patescibacteria group bacterium]